MWGNKLKHIKNSGLFQLGLGVLLLSPALKAQQSWSDSDPKIMVISKDFCPLKVRGLSGEWADYSDTLKKGRKVLGAVNPRRPDVIFFQLQRDGRFMFAAARTCFEGEEDWNIRLQEETQGYKMPPRQRKYITLSLDLWRYSGVLSGGNEDLNLKYTSGSIGYDWIQQQSTSQMYFGLRAFLGGGVSDGESDTEGSSWSTEKKFGFHVGMEGTALYGFKTVPYAVGGGLLIAYLQNSFTTNIIGTSVTPSRVAISPSVIGRIYVDGWMLEPSLSFPGFKPKNATFRVSVGFDI